MSFDDILKVVAAFDWISPTTALVQDLEHGDVVELTTAMSKWEVKRKLGNIPCWGFRIDDGFMAFTVPADRAKEARHALAN
jgi:hypothetical protein